MRKSAHHQQVSSNLVRLAQKSLAGGAFGIGDCMQIGLDVVLPQHGLYLSIVARTEDMNNLSLGQDRNTGAHSLDRTPIILPGDRDHMPE
jgi:hypothetical protein